MEKAMLQQLLQAAVHPHSHQLVGVDAHGAHRLEVGELHPFDPLHREHPAAGGLVVDAGYGDAGITGVQLGEGFGVAGLIEVIHLLEHPLAQLIDQGHQVGADQTHVAVEPGGDIAHDVEIERDLLAQTGPLHLHGHGLPPLEHPFMHLAEGGGGDGLPVQLLVDGRDRRAQILLNAGHRQGRIKARQLILQLGQLLQQHRRHDVGPGGEGLASLDEGRAEGGDQIGGFPGPDPGVLGILEALGEPVDAHPQQKEADWDQGLPQAPQQPLGVAGVDPGDGGRVVLQQAGSLDEITHFVGGHRRVGGLSKRAIHGSQSGRGVRLGEPTRVPF